MSVAVSVLECAPAGAAGPGVGGYTPDAQVLGGRDRAQAVEFARDVVCYK